MNPATELDSQIRRLHALYVQLVSPVDLTMPRMFAWKDWLAYITKSLANTGSTATPEQVLRVVVGWRRKRYKDARHIMVSLLAFGHLIGKPDLCEEDFAAWRAERRARAQQPEAGLALVERATGRGAATDARAAGKPAQSVGQIMERLPQAGPTEESKAAVAELLRKLREDIGR